jgi:shikimate dehydrogenase
MYPKSNGESPVALEKFKSCQGVLDMIFNPAKTGLLLDAERLGIPSANGLAMLVAQAKRACELFVGESVPDGEIDRITTLIANETGNIILVGMPGSGKTTVGKLLAEMTGRQFIDTDEMIASSHGRTPSDIIIADGEENFRQIEHEEVKNAGKMSGMIIATGGGVVTRRENFDPLRQNGKIFFIHRSLDKLPTENRPLSQQTGIGEIYRARLPFYRELCDLEVSNDETAETCAVEILKKYGKA